LFSAHKILTVYASRRIIRVQPALLNQYLIGTRSVRFSSLSHPAARRTTHAHKERLVTDDLLRQLYFYHFNSQPKEITMPFLRNVKKLTEFLLSKIISINADAIKNFCTCSSRLTVIEVTTHVQGGWSSTTVLQHVQSASPT
jgi:hypothetical protein